MPDASYVIRFDPDTLRQLAADLVQLADGTMGDQMDTILTTSTGQLMLTFQVALSGPPKNVIVH